MHEKYAGAGQIIGVEELAPGRTGAPTNHAGGFGCLRLVEFADQGGQDMRRFEVIVVIRPVHVGGHGADKVAAVLATVGLAEFDAGDFGDGIPLIGRFQRAGKQIILLQWLGRQLRINAGAAQEEQFDNSGLAGAANQIVLDLKILI